MVQKQNKIWNLFLRIICVYKQTCEQSKKKNYNSDLDTKDVLERSSFSAFIFFPELIYFYQKMAFFPSKKSFLYRSESDLHLGITSEIKSDSP